MKKNPVLAERPNHGHYNACCDRMTSIKNISKYLLIYTLVSGFVMIVFLLARSSFDLAKGLAPLAAGSFSVLPGLISKPESVAFMMLHIIEVGGLIVCSILNMTKYKIGGLIAFVLYSLMLISAIFTGWNTFLNVGTVIDIIGIVFSFRCFSAYLDYKQLSETEGFPYFSLLFEQNEEREYKSLYQEQLKSMPRNPERKFGDNAPIPIRPEHAMTDLSDVPYAKPLARSGDDEKKDYFEEV